VNDTANNINMSTLFTTYAYSVLETNFSYNNQTMSGLVETFSINATVNPMYSGALVYLTYNNTNYTMTTSDTGTNKIWSKSLSIPVVTGWTNKTFFFSFILANATNIYAFDSLTHNQTIEPFNLDNCTSSSKKILNFRILNEEDLAEALNGTIKITT
jgi:hypothetical protein